MFRIILTFCVLILLSACQPARELETNINNVDVINAFTTQSQAEKQLSEWKVNCLDSKKCPDSVGQLLVTDGRILGACTATMIGPDTALTNSHCFNMRDSRTGRMADPDLICQSGTRIVFASQSPSGPEQIKCKKILTKSQLGEAPNILYPDYAVIQLERSTSRKFDLVTRAGIENEMKLTMRKVNPVRTGLGELEVKECQSQFQTLLTPLATSSHYHVHIVLGCETKLGNSGSSVVDAQGDIRGVLYQGIGENSRAPRSALERELLNRAEKEKVSFVANTTCMDHSFSGVSARDEKKCASYARTASKLTDTVGSDEIKNQFSDFVVEESKSLVLTESFGYRFYYLPSQRTFVYTPYCVKVSSQPYYGMDYPISIESSFQTWSPSIKVGPQMKAEVKTMISTQKFCTVTFSYAQFLKNKKGTVELSGPSCLDSKGQSKQGYDVWEVCKP